MKRILVVGDSLTLPRDKPETCVYQNTWPELLKKSFIVHQVSIGGGTIRDLHRQLEYYKAYNPDIVILQSGIVDCAPRSLSQFEVMVLEKNWFTRKFFLPLVKRNSKFLRKVRGKTYTPAGTFSSFLDKIKKQLPGAKIYSLAILPTNDQYELVVPGITKKVKEYNEILKKHFGTGFISLDEIDRKGIMSDHIHLNEIGHLYVYNILMNTI
ncbi:MAG TPA: SGNH/GDSL hydrolase family protein [Ohtaekwangia sp.]|uniref:SGNH/GDSL hydrolase family protein n=1 Tax=Ohtaekwangia sp. TaxID=2066019 RepID=UPI002F92B647